MTWDVSAALELRAGGARLEARCFGQPPGRAPTLVLLHEGLGSLGLWRDFPARLAAATGFGVFAYSRRGYGNSEPIRAPRPFDYMTCEAIEVLPEVLNAFGFRRGVLLGHSDGASIAALYLGNRADHRVRGLILMAPHFFTEPMGLRAIADARAAFDRGGLRARLARHHRDVEGAFRGWNDAWLDPGFAAWNIEEALDYVRVPVLAIQGREDGYGTLEQIRALERRLYSPFESLILDHCGHAPFIDQPEATLTGIATFLDRLERIEAPGAAGA
jgi:pimeloyl-ACP methyl ester carboxylesterase